MSSSGAEIAGRKLTLRSSDGEVYEVEEMVALEFQTIKHMVEDDCVDDVIPLPNVTGEILSKVIEYCKKHVDAVSAMANYVDGGRKILLKIIEYGNENDIYDSLSKIIEACEKHVSATSTIANYKDSVNDDDRKFLWEIIEYGEKHVTGELLWKIIEDCEKHVNTPSIIADDLKTFDANFLIVDHGTLFDIILAANYLNIKSLLDLTCQAVADMIKGMTPDEIKKTFNLKNNFTPEEEEEIRREEQWAFE